MTFGVFGLIDASLMTWVALLLLLVIGAGSLVGPRDGHIRWSKVKAKISVTCQRSFLPMSLLLHCPLRAGQSYNIINQPLLFSSWIKSHRDRRHVGFISSGEEKLRLMPAKLFTATIILVLINSAWACLRKRKSWGYCYRPVWTNP